jgi:two-component system NtrC family sensor kinase
MKLTQTIAFKLFALIALVQALIVGGLAIATVSVQQSNLMENVVLGASRLSDIIVRSARHSMLLDQKEDVQQIIASVGGEPGLEGIRVYNKQGEIIFATSAADRRTKVDIKAEACVSCHSEGLEASNSSSKENLSRIFTKPNGQRVLGLITPIRNERQCSDADCHAHPESKTILGVLDVRMSLVQVDRRLQEAKSQLTMLSIGAVLLIALVSGGFIWLFVRRPVKRLMAGMEQVSSGHLDERLESASNDELGQLSMTFNVMTADLDKARREITAWSNTLEQRITEKTDELQRAHRQMLRVEKMASLGNLSSSVAHELNNPLEGILTFAKLLIKRVQKSILPPEEIQRFHDDLKLVADEAQRCGNIVKNLLLFARQGGMSFQTIRLHTILDRCAMLVNHHAQMNNIRIETSCTDDDVCECDPDQIQQVLLALMMNAIEAMAGMHDRPNGGLLTITVRWDVKSDSLAIKVADNGNGMSEEVKAHIFEPFFTTKSEGKGVGLGLAIAYGIIERHHGSIDVESTVGRGTSFTLTLPTKQPVGARLQQATSPAERLRHEQE